MITVRRASRIEWLLPGLVEFLADRPDDPFEAQWVMVPSAAIRQWLSFRLSFELVRRDLVPSYGGGVTAGVAAGVTANIRFPLPGDLRNDFLEGPTSAGLSPRPAGIPVLGDAWKTHSLRWVVYDVLSQRGWQPGGVDSAVSRAGRIADLFDRYHRWRPGMILRWLDGDDVDGLDRPLADALKWQPSLWRDVRVAVGEPCPPEVAALISGSGEDVSFSLGLPARLAVFGLESLSPDLEHWLEIVSPERHVELFHLVTSFRAAGEAEQHPLARSWGAISARSVDVLAPYQGSPLRSGEAHDAGLDSHDESAKRASLLDLLHSDIGSNRPPDASRVMSGDDRSISVHGCAGPMRQAEVARDAIWHLLNEDHSLTESDIAVIVPSLQSFEAYVTAAFSSPMPLICDDPLRPSTPDVCLKYRVAERTIGRQRPFIDALTSLLGLLRGRATAAELLEFCSFEPVQNRFSISSDDIATVYAWRENLNIRWGLTTQHVNDVGVDESHIPNTWTAALDRILLGAALAPPASAPGFVPGYPADESALSSAARVAALVEMLEADRLRVSEPRTISDWIAWLSGCAETYLATLPDQREPFDRAIERISTTAAQRSLTTLSFGEFVEMIGRTFSSGGFGQVLNPGFVTVASPTAIRGLPFRVVVILGMDDDTGAAVGSPSDDLIAYAPLPRDPDFRAEARQMLLDAVLSARERLVITYSDRNPNTNEAVPPSVRLQELFSVLDTTCSVEPITAGGDAQARSGESGGSGVDRSAAPSVSETITTSHPLSPYDSANFAEGWSFDVRALDGIRARDAARTSGSGPALASVVPARDETSALHGRNADGKRSTEPGADGKPSADLETDYVLAELSGALSDPLRVYVREGLQARFPYLSDEPTDVLPTEVAALESTILSGRLIEARLAGRSTVAEMTALQRSGLLPLGAIGERGASTLMEQVEGICGAAGAAVGDPFAFADGAALVVGPSAVTDVDLKVLPHGGREAVRVRGAVRLWRGHVVIARYTRNIASLLIDVWIQLAALVAAGEPAIGGGVACRGENGGFSSVRVNLLPEYSKSPERCAELLGWAVAFRRRALCTPIPVTPTCGYSWAKLAEESDARSAWDPKRISDMTIRGEGGRPEVVAALGELDFDTLLSSTTFSNESMALWQRFSECVDYTITDPAKDA